MFIFITILSVSLVDRYKEVNLMRKDNKCVELKSMYL
jgi:hypothetical protein